MNSLPPPRYFPNGSRAESSRRPRPAVVIEVMRRITGYFARLVGTTAEDWMLGAMIVAVIATVVVGVRSCEGPFHYDPAPHVSGR